MARNIWNKAVMEGIGAFPEDHPSVANNNYGGIFSPTHLMHDGSKQSINDVRTQDWGKKVQKLKSILGEEIDTVRHAFQTYAQHVDSQPSAITPYSQSLVNTGFFSPNFLSILRQAKTPQLKCETTMRACSTLSIQELNNAFPLLLADVFGFSGGEGWGLNVLEPEGSLHDYHAVYEFLKPGGYLFNVMQKLLNDHNFLFQFPVSCLPGSVLSDLQKGCIPVWYQEKFSVMPGSNLGPSITFNALEYYVVLFVYFVVHPDTRRDVSQWSGINNVLYVHLLEDYLNHFIPLDKSSIQSQAATPNRSVPLQWSPSNIFHQSSVADAQKLSYFTHGISMSADHLDRNVLKAETFLQILCDFWLGQDAGDSPVAVEQDYFLPSVDHARMVRILVKYLHLYVNSSSSLPSFTGHFVDQKIDEFKRVLIPALVQKKLYNFLKRCFIHWPLDGSFRMVLETWLSYIQPWRYIDQNASVHEESVAVDLNPWKAFIADNAVFYSSLFLLFIPRALRYDFKSLRDIQHIYRVAKVFSQPGLIEVLQDVEERIQSSSGGGSFQSHSPFSSLPRINMMSTIHRTSLEHSERNWQPLFGAEAVKSVHALCVKLADATTGIRHKVLQAERDSEARPKTWYSRLKEFLMVADGDDMDRHREEQRLTEYLERSCFLLTSVFKLSGAHGMSDLASFGDAYAERGSRLPRPEFPHLRDETLPDCVMTENGIMLTDKGRYQIIQGLRRFDVVYSGDPELQPIRSYECAAVVRLMYRIASSLNEKYGSTLERLYNRPDLIGCSLRKFSQGLETAPYAGASISLSRPSGSTGRLAPRVSLRFMGSYYFLGYFCWLVILARLFGFGWLAVLMAVALLLLTCVVYNVTSPSRRLKND